MLISMQDDLRKAAVPNTYRRHDDGRLHSKGEQEDLPETVVCWNSLFKRPGKFE